MIKFIRALGGVTLCALAVSVSTGASAQEAATTTPTKVYASAGGSFGFAVAYTGGEAAITDLAVTYTANTTSPVITPFSTACIPGVFTPPYASANPNEFYLNWEPATGTYPANCGGAAAAAAMATFTGVASTFVGGKYVIQVWNNASLGAVNDSTNDVTVCEKRTIQSVTPPANFVEGGNGTFTITLDSAVAAGCGGFSVPFVLSGPAVAGKAATPTSGSCTFADGATSCVTGAISTSQNALSDGDMALTLTVTNSGASDSYVSTGGKAGTVTVLDDEVGASVVATTQASETGPTNGVVTFARTGSTAAALNLTSAISGTATYTTDYSITAGTCAIVTQSASTITVTVPAASANCTINIVPVDDALVEGNETAVFGVPTGTGVAGTGAAATITITDNDTPPVFSLTKAGACAEAAVPTNCSFTIARDSGVATATTVNFTVTGTATRGIDYTLNTGGCAGTVLAANSISHPDANPLVINVCPIDDLTIETGGETVILTLTANPPTYTLGAVATQTQTISDDDSPQVVTVAVAPATASENAGVLTYTFTRSGGSAAAQAATLAVTITPPAASGRYTSTCASPVTFAAASSTATCTVTGINNAVVDGNVSVVATVVANGAAVPPYSVGSPASATGTLLDDEVGVSVTAASATEGSPVSFTISCTGTLAGPVLIPYTITGVNAPDGPAPVGPASIASCPGSVVVTVPTFNDTINGNTRNATLTLGALPAGTAASGPQSAIAAILDNDVPQVIPTMGALGLGLMSLMLAGLVGFQRRRLGK